MTDNNETPYLHPDRVNLIADPLEREKIRKDLEDVKDKVIRCVNRILQYEQELKEYIVLRDELLPKIAKLKEKVDEGFTKKLTDDNIDSLYCSIDQLREYQEQLLSAMIDIDELKKRIKRTDIDMDLYKQVLNAYKRTMRDL